MRQRNVKNKDIIIEECMEFIADAPEDMAGKWSSLFGNDHPLFLEIGSGKGRFISTLAQLHPENNYIACEANLSVGVRILQKARALELKNIKVILKKMESFSDCFAEDEISGLYLNFSDPLPKERMAKHRLTHRRMLSQYRIFLKEGAAIAFKTDNDMLFDFTLEEAAAEQLTIAELTRDLHSGEYAGSNIMTEYEEKFSAGGKNINYVLLKNNK